MKKIWRRLGYQIKEIIFNSGSISFCDWPVSILLKIVIFRENYIREFCCYCQNKSFDKYYRSTKTGDSGSICPPCLKRESPQAYQDAVDKGLVPPQPLAESHGY